jgi:hypothetical protein
MVTYNGTYYKYNKYNMENIMDKSKIKKQLNKVFEMTSSSFGIVGIESLHDKKKVKKEKDITKKIGGPN